MRTQSYKKNQNFNKVKMVVSASNMLLINQIMNNGYSIIHFPLFSKYVNDKFDILIQNNSNIIVVDKILKRIYKDLKTAWKNIY